MSNDKPEDSTPQKLMKAGTKCIVVGNMTNHPFAKGSIVEKAQIGHYFIGINQRTGKKEERYMDKADYTQLIID